MPQKWIARIAGEDRGPVSSSRLKQWADNGMVKPDTMVRSDEAGQWVRASQVKGLFQPKGPPVSNAPAPLPPAVLVNAGPQVQQKPADSRPAVPVAKGIRRPHSRQRLLLWAWRAAMMCLLFALAYLVLRPRLTESPKRVAATSLERSESASPVGQSSPSVSAAPERIERIDLKFLLAYPEKYRGRKIQADGWISHPPDYRLFHLDWSDDDWAAAKKKDLFRVAFALWQRASETGNDSDRKRYHDALRDLVAIKVWNEYADCMGEQLVESLSQASQQRYYILSDCGTDLVKAFQFGPVPNFIFVSFDEHLPTQLLHQNVDVMGVLDFPGPANRPILKQTKVCVP
jgi:hypothetical protein